MCFIICFFGSKVSDVVDGHGVEMVAQLMLEMVVGMLVSMLARMQWGAR